MNDLKQDFLTYLEAERGYSPTTIATYKKALVSVEIFFKSIDSQLSWQTIDADVMRQWLAAQMERGEGARTMGKELSAVRSFYKYLRRMGVVDHNPMSLIQNPKAQKVLPSFLKEQEIIVIQISETVTWQQSNHSKASVHHRIWWRKLHHAPMTC